MTSSFSSYSWDNTIRYQFHSSIPLHFIYLHNNLYAKDENHTYISTLNYLMMKIKLILREQVKDTNSFGSLQQQSPIMRASSDKVFSLVECFALKLDFQTLLL